MRMDKLAEQYQNEATRLLGRLSARRREWGSNLNRDKKRVIAMLLCMYRENRSTHAHLMAYINASKRRFACETEVSNISGAMEDEV